MRHQTSIQSWAGFSARALGALLLFAACSSQQTNSMKNGDPAGDPDASALGGGSATPGGSGGIAPAGSGGNSGIASGSGGSGLRSGPDARASMTAGTKADAGVGDADGGSSSSPMSSRLSDSVEQLPAGAHCDAPTTQSAVTLTSSCPMALCGNGQVDSCMGPQQCDEHGGCYTPTESEECDTTVSVTCESMGFVRGQVACSSTCNLDWSGCEVCGTDPRIEACTRVDGLHYDQSGQTLAAASNGEHAAIVWPSQGRLRFALVNDDLSLAPTDCFTDEAVNWSPYLAAISNGWILAYGVDHGDGTQSVQITLLDANGTVTAKPAPSISGIPTALVGRPDGGPLLLFHGPSNAPGDDPTAEYAMAALLDASGQPLWTRRLTEVQNAVDVTATYTGDGFLWADRPNGTDPLLARFELDGTTTTTTLALGEVNYFTRLVWTGAEARLFWGQSFMSLDRTGHALGAARKLIDDDHADLPFPVQLGAQTAVLLAAGEADPILGGLRGNATETGHRSLVTLDQNGVAQPPFVVFANGNQGPAFLRQLVVVKDRLLAAFVSYDERYHLDPALYLASIRP
jgi:hypothetical protein